MSTCNPMNRQVPNTRDRPPRRQAGKRLPFSRWNKNRPGSLRCTGNTAVAMDNKSSVHFPIGYRQSTHHPKVASPTPAAQLQIRPTPPAAAKDDSPAPAPLPTASAVRIASATYCFARRAASYPNPPAPPAQQRTRKRTPRPMRRPAHNLLPLQPHRLTRRTKHQIIRRIQIPTRRHHIQLPYPSPATPVRPPTPRPSASTPCPVSTP